jgi:hypothetical protein
MRGKKMEYKKKKEKTEEIKEKWKRRKTGWKTRREEGTKEEKKAKETRNIILRRMEILI